jgi:hypothetical protein
MYFVYFIKRWSTAIPPFVILRFDIRYSAVRCLIQTIETGSLSIEKTCHFGVVSYEGSKVIIGSMLISVILDLVQ